MKFKGCPNDKRESLLTMANRPLIEVVQAKMIFIRTIPLQTYATNKYKKLHLFTQVCIDEVNDP